MSKARGTLRTELRNLIGASSTGSSANPADTKLNSFLNLAAQDVQDEIEVLDENYFLETIELFVAGADVSVGLPTGFRKLIDLWRVDGSNKIRLKHVDLRLRAEGMNADEKYRYYLSRNTIVYHRALDEDHTLRLDYIKNIAEIADANDTETWPVPVIGDRLIVHRAAILYITSENGETGGVAALYGELLQKLPRVLQGRQVQAPRTVNYYNK